MPHTHLPRTFLTARKSGEISRGNERSAVKALALAAALVGWSLVSPRLPSRWHPVPNAVVGTALAVLTQAPLGLRPPASRSGARLGLAVAGPLAVGVLATTALPQVRAGMADRRLPDAPLRWLLLDIPLGTVWSEEASYRAALGTVAAQAFGPAGGRVLQSAAFGLSHIADARAGGLSVVPTVVVTAIAGWGFAWLYERSGSLIASMLVHLATNEAGAVATIALQGARIKRLRRTPGRP